MPPAEHISPHRPGPRSGRSRWCLCHQWSGDRPPALHQASKGGISQTLAKDPDARSCSARSPHKRPHHLPLLPYAHQKPQTGGSLPKVPLSIQLTPHPNPSHHQVRPPREQLRPWFGREQGMGEGLQAPPASNLRSAPEERELCASFPHSLPGSQRQKVPSLC